MFKYMLKYFALYSMMFCVIVSSSVSAVAKPKKSSSESSSGASAELSKKDEVQDDVLKYANDLIVKCYSILNGKLPLDQKSKVLKKLMSDNLDISLMSKKVLGIAGKSITKEQFDNFRRVYGRYIVESYGESVKLFNNQVVRIDSVTSRSADTYVIKTSVINDESGAAPININYMLRKYDDGSLKIFDIITENIGLLQSQRTEYTSIILSQGIDELIKQLDAKASQLASQLAS